ncbi:GNAT family N-acetyltransferase [Nocardioides pyridinolyticus]
MSDIEVGVATDAERFVRTDTVVWFQEVLPAPAEEHLLGLPADLRFAAETDGPSDPSTYPGIYGAYPLELAVPGGDLVPCAGLTWVGVHPDHRRRGVLSAMLRHHLEQVHDTPGTHVSALHASEPAIYGRYGYGLASLELPITLGRGASLTAPGLDEAAATITTRMADASDPDTPHRMHVVHRTHADTGAIVGAPAYYERVCQSFP